MKWLILLFFAALGLGALVGGGAWAIRRYRALQEGLSTQGTVVEQHEITTTESGEGARMSIRTTTYYPVVEFKTQGGVTIRFRGSTGGVGTPEIETGTAVQVIYDPARPAEAQIGGFSQFWLGPVVVTACGLLMLLMGVGSFILIGGGDRQAAASQETVRRAMLAARPDAIHLKGTVRAVRKSGDGQRYVFACAASEPRALADQEFVSDCLTFDPGRSFVGRSVDIYVDPKDRHEYYVNLGPMLSEILRHQPK